MQQEGASVTDGTLVPLNRTEHMFWAGEGYLGSITQPYLLRFDGPLDVALVRQALRELTSAYPRLRGVMVPTPLTYKLKILPDDRLIDQLVDDALRVVHGVDASSSQALLDYQNELLNEHLSMERGLPWRARLIPHPSQPALIFSLHHIIGDGRSLMQMISAIVARLNGQPIKPVPLQSHSMIPAVVPLTLAKWPASIAAWWRNSRRDAQANKDETVVTLGTRKSERFTTSRLHYHELPCGPGQLRAKAKAMGTTVNSLVTAVIANSFLARQPHNPQAVAAIRISYDLRRHFPDKAKAPEIGNFVASFAVRARHQPTLAAQIQSIEAQVKEFMGRYERREYAVPQLLYEALPVIGRRLYSFFVLKAKAAGKLQDVSCHFSNLGGADFINPADATLRVTEFWPCTQPVATIMGLLSLGDKLYFPVIHQIDETDQQTVKEFLQALDEGLRTLLQSQA
jgi:NRPS condensation-like uncharacterized protein